MGDWEGRRLEEAIERQTAVLERLVKLEAMAVVLLQKLVESQAAPTFPQPTAVAVKVTP